MFPFCTGSLPLQSLVRVAVRLSVLFSVTKSSSFRKFEFFLFVLQSQMFKLVFHFVRFQVSPHSDALRAGWLGFDSRQGQEIFFFSTVSIRILCSTHANLLVVSVSVGSTCDSHILTLRQSYSYVMQSSVLAEVCRGFPAVPPCPDRTPQIRLRPLLSTSFQIHCSPILPFDAKAVIKYHE
jgi:hypothetical protein